MSKHPSNGKERAAVSRRSVGSLLTTASGIANSTISFNTFATGITDESLRLSQFPPPPTTIPTSPATDGSPSPTRSTFTITSNPTYMYKPTSPLAPRRQDSDSSTATTKAGNSRAFPFRPVPTPSTLPRKTKTPPSVNSSRTLSPYDWHEGSSSISVDPTEEGLLSTTFITDLLSSTSESSHSLQPVDGFYSPQQGQRHLYQADSGSLISEMTYPPRVIPSSPPLPRRGDVTATLSRPGPTSYTPVDIGGRSTSASNRTYGDTETIGSSYETDATVLRGVRGLSRKVSVVGMAPAILRHVSSGESIPGASDRASPMTFNSNLPLNPGRPSGFSTTLYELSVPQEFGEAGVGATSSTQMLFSPAAPSSAGYRPSYTPSGPRERRISTTSAKSMKSQVSSFISAAGQKSVRAVKQTLERLRAKPLPPVPTIPNMSYLQEQEHRRMEGNVPLPELAERADRLGDMLDAGRLPHDSMGSFTILGAEKPPSHLSGSAQANLAHASGFANLAGARQRVSPSGMPSAENGGLETPTKGAFHRTCSFFNVSLTRTQKIKLSVGLSLLALVVVIAVVVGVVVGHKHRSGPSCTGNLTGAACSLDATCVCTAPGSNQCNPLAQSLINLVPTVNALFNTNFTPSSVAAAAFAAQGASLGSDCAAQARIVDVAPALDIQTVPNRTQWAQSALLWSFVQSLDPSAVGNLQQYILKADWGSLHAVDGPVLSQSSRFTTTTLGFQFDFAGQTLSEPTISFRSDGQPSSAQLSQVSSTASGALDRMYTYAAASSALRQSAMLNYWQSALRQDPKDFPKFISFFTSSPILLPFDATETIGKTPIASLLTSSTSSPFPPPLSCYPDLTSSQLQMVDNLEASVFGLAPATQQSSFDSSCFADRPIYGLLDVLRLRLPYHDSQTNTSKQAVVLTPEVVPRVIVYNGASLSLLPASSSSISPPSNPLQFGTLNHINHVLYNFFSAISDINVAIAFAQYVLSSPAVPPVSGTLLARSLDSIPALEVAVFGSIVPSDVDSVLSSFGTPTGALFFGTDQSLALRNWAINGTQRNIAWADAASAPTVVRDTSFSDAVFNSVWSPAFTFFHSQSNQIVNVGNITSSFHSLNKFVP